MEYFLTEYKILILFVLPLILLTIILVSTPLIEYRGGLDSDGVHYASMANRFASNKWLTQLAYTIPSYAPWCWRVLTPFLVSLLPFPIIGSFKFIAFVSIYISLLLLYGILRLNKLSRTGSVLGMLLFVGVFWTVKFSFYSPCYIEFQTLTFILATLYLALRKTYWAIPVILALGVLQKESILFMIPVVYTLYAQTHGWFSRQSIGYALSLIVLPIVALSIVRLSIHPLNEYSAMDHVLWSLSLFIKPGYWSRIFLEIFSGLGILPCILGLNIKYVYKFLRENLHWLVMIVLGLIILLGADDKARVLINFLQPRCSCQHEFDIRIICF